MTRRYSLQMESVVPVQHLVGEDAELTRELQDLARQARDYIASFKWCLRVKDAYAGIAMPGVVGVFLFEIEPENPEVDTWTWVIVGDLPPAYITPEVARNPVEALEAYMAEMDAWVQAVIAGQSVADLIPVGVPPEQKFAGMLAIRLRLLREEVLEKGVGFLLR
jgi:hypothetical protein